MGSDLTLFLEFYGLPGSGKSTISHMVAEELRKRGKNVIEPTYKVDHEYSWTVRRIMKLMKFFRYALFCPGRCKLLIRLIKLNGHAGSNVFTQCVNITQKLWEYDHARADYVIFDEGLIQSAISLANDDESNIDNEHILYSLCKQRIVKKFYIKISSDVAFKRMNDRDKHDSRIDKITDLAERKNAIRAVEKRCNSISSGIVIEDTSIPLEVDNIMRHIG